MVDAGFYLLYLIFFLFKKNLFIALLRAHGILVPPTRVAPSFPASEAWSLNHWIPRESLYLIFRWENGILVKKLLQAHSLAKGRTGTGPPMAEFLHWTIMVNVMKTIQVWEFPGGPVVRAWRFHCWGQEFNSWSGSCKHERCGKKKKKKRYKWP